jgi:hypothetical protein
VYFTLNPCNDALLARREKNTCDRDVKHTTTDAEIVCRRWLLIDFDPKRPKGVSATKAERLATKKLMLDVEETLRNGGWPEPVIASSGNGYHLLYRVGEPNDLATTDLFKKCLEAIAAKFGTPDVDIDTKVFNAGRITKSYGSLAAKGMNTEERPHRFSKVTYVPKPLRAVTRSQLVELAGTNADVKKRPNGTTEKIAVVSAETLEKFLEWANLDVKSVKDAANGGKKWTLHACPFNAEHTNSPALFLSSAGVLGFKCFHESCSKNRWAQFRAHVEANKGEKFSFANGNGRHAVEVRGGDVPVAVTPEWPDAPSAEAYHGLAGEIVDRIKPHSEADEVAILMQTLAFFGNVVGRGPHFVAEADRHTTNIFPVLVGVTSKGRKGSSLSQVKRPFLSVDPQWVSGGIQSGLSSGEGLIWAVRDPIERLEAIKNKGTVTGYQMVMTDRGVNDKRLLDLETEFAAVLRIIGRDGNTLSATIRQAFDHGDLRILNKNSPATATGAHISIIGHVTRDELRRYLNSTEVGNGFANRFLWTCVRRSKVLPEGGRLSDSDFADIAQSLQAALQFAGSVGEMRRTRQARELWIGVYPELSEGRPGLFGAITSRAEAQVVRLSCIYALLDRSSSIKSQHLRAALALWKYCEDSARYIFGDSLGDPVADELLKALRGNPRGMTRTEIRDHFARNRSASEVDRALGALLEYGVVRYERDEADKGRPSERWFAVDAARSTKEVPGKNK